jgi:hypothetical protein
MSPHNSAVDYQVLHKPGQDSRVTGTSTGGPVISSGDGARVSLALQKPRTLGYHFELWTLERLQAAFWEPEDTHLSDSTIWTFLARCGLVWPGQLFGLYMEIGWRPKLFYGLY